MKRILTTILSLTAVFTSWSQSSLTSGEQVIQPGRHTEEGDSIPSRKRPKANKYSQPTYPAATRAGETEKPAITVPKPTTSHSTTRPTGNTSGTKSIYPDSHAGNYSRFQSLPVTEEEAAKVRGEMVSAEDDALLGNGNFNFILPKAEQGDTESQRLTGICYLYGIGVDRDVRAGREWIAKAAQNENTEAQYEMGVIYRDGYGVTVNYPEAAYWFRKAARNGNAKAQLSTGMLFYEGKGVQQDYRIAAENFWRAAEQGNQDAAYRVATMYRDGIGVPKDLDKAYWYFSTAAKQGDYKDAALQAEQLKKYHTPKSRGGKGRKKRR